MGDAVEATKVVSAGGKEYRIGKFKGYKALRLGRMLTSLGEIGPKVSKAVNEYTTEYREQNVEKISRATLEFRYPADAAGVSDEAWKESGGYIELPGEPGEAEILSVVLPTVFDLAGDAVIDLLAWVVADDSKLEEADNEGEQEVENYIKGIARELKFQADIDELFDLAAAAQEVLGEQMAGKATKARSLLKLVGLEQDQEEPPKAEEQKTESERSETETPSTLESPQTSPRHDSSTDSPPPTDGDEERSSTARAGEPSPSISG